METIYCTLDDMTMVEIWFLGGLLYAAKALPNSGRGRPKLPSSRERSGQITCQWSPRCFSSFFSDFFSEPVYCVEAFEHPPLFLSTVVGVNFQSVFLTGISGSVITAAILCQQFSHSPLVRPNPCQISTLSTFSTPAPRSEGIYHTVPGTSRITFFFRKGPHYGTNIHVTSPASLSSISFRPIVSIGICKNPFVNHAALALAACTCSFNPLAILSYVEMNSVPFASVPCRVRTPHYLPNGFECPLILWYRIMGLLVRDHHNCRFSLCYQNIPGSR